MKNYVFFLWMVFWVAFFSFFVKSEQTTCIALYEPVCWVDGKIYSNECFLQNAWVKEAENMEAKDWVCVEKNLLLWTWILSWYNNSSALDGVKMTIEENRIGWKFCNSWGIDSYHFSGAKIIWGTITKTEMYCESDLMKYEENFALNNSEIVLIWNTLSITTAEGAVYEFFREESLSWMANPASVKCEEDGGTLILEEDEEGNSYWICEFQDGSVCEEWAYFRWECQKKTTLLHGIIDKFFEKNGNEYPSFEKRESFLAQLKSRIEVAVAKVQWEVKKGYEVVLNALETYEISLSFEWTTN